MHPALSQRPLSPARSITAPPMKFRFQFEDFFRLGVVMALSLRRAEHCAPRIHHVALPIVRRAHLPDVLALERRVHERVDRCLPHQDLCGLSRGTAIIFYGSGFGLVVLTRFILVRIVHDQARVGGVAARRISLSVTRKRSSGSRRSMTQVIWPARCLAAVLRGKETLEEDLALAAATARMLRPEDVFISRRGRRRKQSRLASTPSCACRLHTSRHRACFSNSPTSKSNALARSPACISCAAHVDIRDRAEARL